MDGRSAALSCQGTGDGAVERRRVALRGDSRPWSSVAATRGGPGPTAAAEPSPTQTHCLEGSGESTAEAVTHGAAPPGTGAPLCPDQAPCPPVTPFLQDSPASSAQPGHDSRGSQDRTHRCRCPLDASPMGASSRHPQDVPCAHTVTSHKPVQRWF